MNTDLASRFVDLDRRLTALERRTADPALAVVSGRDTTPVDLIYPTALMAYGPAVDIEMPPSGQVLVLLSATVTANVALGFDPAPYEIPRHLYGYINGQGALGAFVSGAAFARKWTVSGLYRLTYPAGSQRTITSSWNFSSTTTGDTCRLLDREISVLPIPELPA